jgi:hypothetical protein
MTGKRAAEVEKKKAEEKTKKVEEGRKGDKKAQAA